MPLSSRVDRPSRALRDLTTNTDQTQHVRSDGKAARDVRSPTTHDGLDADDERRRRLQVPSVLFPGRRRRPLALDAADPTRRKVPRAQVKVVASGSACFCSGSSEELVHEPVEPCPCRVEVLNPILVEE